MQFSDVGLRNLSNIGYYWDSKLPGFGIRIGKQKKTFVCVRKGQRTTLGHYPHLSLQDARRKALQQLYDPVDGQPSLNVGEAISRYLQGLEVRPNTFRFYRQFLRKLEAAYGSYDLDQLTPRQCAEITISPHMHSALKVFFSWARGQALLDKSPMENLKPPGKFKIRQRTLTDPELKAVWNAAGELGTYGIVIKLLCLTAQRRQEIAQVKHEWLQNNCLVIPASVVKNGKEHRLPLTELSTSMFLQFTATSKHSWRNWTRPKLRIDQISQVTNWTLHDLRRTTATNLSRLGTDPFLVERILNHSLPLLQQIYNRHDFTEAMRKPLQDHEDWLLKMVAS